MELEQAILAKLEKVSGPGANGDYTALCPFHNDRNTPNLSVNFEKGCYKCFACGSKGPLDRLAARLGIDIRGMAHPKNGGTVEHPPKNGKISFENRLGTVPRSSETPGTAEQSRGLTLEELATSKKLPVSFLRELAVSDCKYQKSPAVRIPYYDEGGSEAATRFRLRLHKGEKGAARFAWKKGSHVMLYGLERLAEIKKVGWILLVEGESDCWTLWHYGLPALGIPGKGTWKQEWAEFLKGIEVYLWQEPDAPELPAKVGKDIPNLKVIAAGQVKDVSEAHCLEYDLPSYIAHCKESARLASEIERESQQMEITELRARAAPVLNSERDVLDLVRDAIRAQGFGGDLTAPVITYLAATCRLLELREGGMFSHLLLIGPTSAGKSHIVKTIKRLLPEDTSIEIHAGSPMVLVYLESELRHRVLIFSEADSMPQNEDSPVASAIRNLLQDGRLHYQVVQRDKESKESYVRTIDKEGPTVLITTSTKPLPEQLGTRLFTLEVPADKEQIQAALHAQGEIEAHGIRVVPQTELIAYQAYLQALAPFEVVVPFADRLADMMGKSEVSPRMLRDFSKLVALVKATTILRHAHRRRDTQGRLMATLEDYGAVRGLVAEMYEATATGASARMRDVVACADRLQANSDTAGVSNAQIVKELNLPKVTISRLVKAAIRNGWLVNSESRRGYPARLQRGEPLPEKGGLPTAEELGECSTVPPVPLAVGTPQGAENSFKNGPSEGSVPLFHPNQGDITSLSFEEVF